MSKARHILAVVAVATALCADQAGAGAAAPLPKPPVTEMAARLVERLSQPFRRNVPSAVRPITRSRTAFVQVVIPPRPALVPAARSALLSPLQFSLPPPLA
jgi:hypothetical protein